MTPDSPYARLLARHHVREHRTVVLGTDTHYWEYGPADAETVMLAVHGYRGDHHGLEPVIAHLDGVRVISPDLPGFGESAPLVGRPHDIAGYSAWLREFARQLGLESTATIVGHSFGSIVVAAAIADGLDAPRIVLINPIAAPALAGPQGILSRLTLIYYRLARVLPARVGAALVGNWVIVQFMSSFMTHTRAPALRRWIHGQHHRYFSAYANRNTVVEGFEASISSYVAQFAEHLTMPTLLLAADRDPITSQSALRELQTQIPDARLTVIEGVGHLIHYEKPREAATEIVAFVGAGRVQS